MQIFEIYLSQPLSKWMGNILFLYLFLKVYLEATLKVIFKVKTSTKRLQILILITEKSYRSCCACFLSLPFSHLASEVLALDLFLVECLPRRALWMWGITPPPAIVALIKISNSSSPLIARSKCLGVILLTLKSLEAFPANSKTSAVKYSKIAAA